MSQIYQIFWVQSRYNSDHFKAPTTLIFKFLLELFTFTWLFKTLLLLIWSVDPVIRLVHLHCLKGYRLSKSKFCFAQEPKDITYRCYNSIQYVISSDLSQKRQTYHTTSFQFRVLFELERNINLACTDEISYQKHTTHFQFSAVCPQKCSMQLPDLNSLIFWSKNCTNHKISFHFTDRK